MAWPTLSWCSVQLMTAGEFGVPGGAVLRAVGNRNHLQVWHQEEDLHRGFELLDAAF